MSSLFVPLILFNGASATFNDAANSVVSAASVLNDQVGGWSSAQGLQGALAIQNKFPALSSALGGFQDSVKSASSSDIDVQTVHHLSASLSELLDSLSKKAADFNAVAAGGIAAGDLKALSTPATDIIDSFIKAVDEPKWNQVSGDLHSLESKLNDANKVYGISPLQFSPDPTFSGKSSAVAGTKPSGSSVASNKSPSASEATGKFGSTLKSGSSVAKPTANIFSSNGTTNGTIASTHDAPHLKNGAANHATGLAAVGAAIAAGAVAALV